MSNKRGCKQLVRQHVLAKILCGQTAARMLVAMKGHPGCGKSRLARSLGKALGWPVLDKDDIRDCTFPLQHDLHVPAHLLNGFSYQTLWRLVGTQLEMGLSVIADCPLSRPSLFLSVASLATHHSMRLLIIECVASDSDEWKRRLEGRVASADAVGMDGDQVQHQETLGMIQDALKSTSSKQFIVRDDGDIGQTSSGESNARLVECAASPHEAGVSNRNQEIMDVVHDSKGSKGDEEAPYRGWHKPGSWEGLQKLIQAYGNCWDYDTSASCKKLVVDTTTLHHDALVSGALKWIRAVSDETPAVTYLIA